MPRIVATQPIFPEVASRLQTLGELVENDTGATLAPDEIERRLADADAMLAFMTDRVDSALLRAAPRLRIVACALKGHDNFDVGACTRAGVWLTIVPDLLTGPTAELALALTLGLNRNLLAGDARVRSGDFEGWRPDLYGFGLDGAMVGIAGLGRVGLAVARRFAGFDVRLLGADARAIAPADLADAGIAQVAWETLAAQSDVIILALPLNPATLHLVNAASLRLMRPGARLVNVGRGSVVDEAAVADALADGRLAGYAADVFETEDWGRADRPRAIEPRLRALRDRTLFTPHLGSAVRTTRLAIEHAAADQIAAVLSGRRPKHALNTVPTGSARSG